MLRNSNSTHAYVQHARKAAQHSVSDPEAASMHKYPVLSMGVRATMGPSTAATAGHIQLALPLGPCQLDIYTNYLCLVTCYFRCFLHGP